MGNIYQKMKNKKKDEEPRPAEVIEKRRQNIHDFYTICDV